MSSLRLQQIEKRIDAYTQMGEIPADVAPKIQAHYMEDVPVLLLEIKKLKTNEAQFIEICSDMNGTIEQLRGQVKSLKKQMRKNAEKYDLHKDVFGTPSEPVVKDKVHPRPRQTTLNNTGE